MPQMNDSDLCALIDKLSDNAIGADDLSADQRAKAMEFYLGEAKGELAPPETSGRSSVVSKDLMDTVEWAMPALMDIFASADDIIRFVPDSQEDEQSCQDATNYVGYLIHRRNQDGFITIHDAIKSALMCRAGFGKTYLVTRQDYREETYNGLSQGELQALSEDPEIEVIAKVQDGVLPPEAIPPGMPPEAAVTYGALCRRREDHKEFKNEGVPPEEIRLAKDTRVISETRFIEHRREVTVSYLLEQGYPEDLVDKLASDDGDADSEEELSRHDYDGSMPSPGDETDPSQRKVELSESYLRVDFDGDGKVEYRRVVKAGSVVFENDVTDDHPFWLLTPILMPYKAIGLSFYDLVEDLQRIKTALTRQCLDNVYLSNMPRTEAVIGQVDFDDLLNPRPGGVVKVKQLGQIREIKTEFVAGAGLQMLQEFDQVRDTRTGVTEMNSAVNAESLAKGNVGSEGVQALIAQGAQRLRLIARVMAETGFKRMYYLMLKLATQHQDRVQQVRINGRWLTIDPREWRNRYDMEVSVGIGTAGRQQQIANLTLVGQVQEKLLPMGLATPANVYQTATRLVEAMGYRDAEQFFTAPQQGGQPQQGEPEQSPEAQAIVAAEQIKAQASLQKAKMDNETRMRIAQAEINSKERVAMFEAREKLALERGKAMLRPSAPAPAFGATA